MNYPMERVKKRDPLNTKPIIASINGDNSHKRAIDKALKKYKLRYHYFEYYSGC